MAARGLILVAALAAACGTPRWAVIDGRRVERPSLGYSDGHHYAIQHRRAFPDVFAPRRAQVVDDGRIVGRACGLDLDFDASWYGARVSLIGRTDVAWKRDFTRTEGLFTLVLDIAQPAPGRRRMLGGEPLAIDIDVSPERLVAQIGPRHYDLAADGSWLVGRVTGLVWRNGRAERVDEPMAVYARQKLAEMPPADEALVLVTMLSCAGVSLDRDGQKVRGFSLVPLSD